MANTVNDAVVSQVTGNENEVVAMSNDDAASSSVVAVGEVVGAPAPAPAGAFRLNPSAMEWNPAIHRSPEEDRCLYLTFSNGFPLTERQVSDFFVGQFGVTVETVYLHREQPPANGAQHPLFGKVVFRSFWMARLVMNGSQRREFVINGRTMWCKKFLPRAVRHPQP